MADVGRQLRVFVSSPGDARFERARLDRVVERLNGEFQGVARLTAIRWETEFYKAHETFQAQIPEAAQCDIVVAIFRGRLGTELPAEFPPMPNGKPYPSGTAYEVLSAIDASKGRGLPDVYVFRCPQPPLVQLDDPNEAETKGQWDHLKAFFESWFMTPDGQFKAAFQTFSTTDDFETQVEALLRKWLEDKVLHGRSVTWPVEIKGSPFRGLAAFGAKHASVFFGRNRDIAKATDRLKDAAEKKCAFLLVDGASGSGKSSLVRAGLVPRLSAAGVVPSIDVWRTAIMRPGEAGGDPFAAIARALYVGTEDLPDDEQGRLAALPEIGASDFKQPEDLAALLGHADDTALKPIVGALATVERAVREKDGYERDVKSALLLVVDQLDELFDAQIAEDVRTRFTTLLGLLARSGRVWIIATLRADLFDRFLGQPILKQLKEDGASYDLAPPDMVELAEIVRGPAAAADLIYDTDSATGERLDERLLKDADRPDLLPLLQFTLNQLFAARETTDHRSRLTFAAYRTLGGLEGAVDKEAESAVQALGEPERGKLPRLLRELAVPAADSGSGATRTSFDIRSVPLAEAAYDESSAKLVRALVDARILLSSGEGSRATVRLAHARVLESWQRARTIVAENADFYRIRAGVEEQQRRWDATNRSRDFLVGRGRPLAEAETILRQFHEELSPATRDFIKLSGRRARMRQTLTAAAAVLFAVVAVVAVVAMWQAVLAVRQAEDQRQRAEEALKTAAQERDRAEDALKTAAQERDRAQQGLAAATQLANSLVFGTVSDFHDRGLSEDVRRMADRIIQSYDQVIKIDPTADSYNGRGSAYLDKGDFDHAIADFDSSIALDATHAYVFRNRGVAYKGKGDFDRAIADYSQAIKLTPKQADSYVDRGRAYRAKGDFDLAIADFDQAIKLNPKSTSAFDNRGDVYKDKGDIDHAIADYSEAIKLDPKYAAAYNDRGNAYSAKGDFDRAIADLNQTIQLDPKGAYAFRNRGLAYKGKGDFDHAIADFGQAITLDPKYTFAFVNRGDAYKDKGEIDHAIADYSEAVKLDPKYATSYNDRGNAYRAKGDFDRAIADFSQTIQLDPKGAYAFRNRGLTYKDKGDFDHAIADFDQAITLDPKYTLAFVNRGDAYKEKGDFDHAIADYSQAITLDAKYAAAYSDRGNAYRAKGDLDQAMANFDRAIQLDPNAAYAFNNRGLVYNDRGDRDRAIAEYDKAIKLDPNAAYAFRNRGLAYEAAGDFDRAIADFDQAITLDPKSALAFDNRGNAYKAKGDVDHAIADYSQAIKLDPKFAVAYGDRGLAYITKGDPDHAIADFDQAIILNPKSGGSYAGRGLAYAVKRDFDRALSDYSQTIALNPKMAFAYQLRGDIYLDKGDLDRAIADFNQAIALDPKSSAVYLSRGRAFSGKNDFDAAIADFNQTIALDPKSALAYYSRGLAYSNKSEFDRAIADFSETITLVPKYAAAYTGRCWIKTIVGGQLQQGLSDCDESLRLRPNDLETLESRGFAYLRLARPDEAIVDFDAALKIDPKAANALYGRGLAKAKKGDRAGADADTAAAKAIAPDVAEQFAKYGIT